VICATIAGLLHFWILSAFCWMLVEGYHLYKMVVLVFERGANLSIKFYYLFAYGSPLIVVGTSASIRANGYGGHD
ncbi:adhesion G protein-coupled receptor L1, partial [Nephila pilipes]